MGEREQFLNQSQYYNAKAMLNFLIDVEYKQSCINEQCLDVFFKTSILYNFDFQWCFKGKTKILKENIQFTFQEEL